MERVINGCYILVIAIALLLIALVVQHALAAPSIRTIEAAMNLFPGRSIMLNVAGQPLQVTYIGIEPRRGHEFAIIVEAR